MSLCLILVTYSYHYHPIWDFTTQLTTLLTLAKSFVTQLIDISLCVHEIKGSNSPLCYNYRI